MRNCFFLSLHASKAVTPSPVSKQKRTRGPGKSKRPGSRQSDDQMLPGCASKTPPGLAKGVSSSSGEAEKRKEQDRAKFPSLVSNTLMIHLHRQEGMSSEATTGSKSNVSCLPTGCMGAMTASAQLGSLPTDDTNSCIL